MKSQPITNKKPEQWELDLIFLENKLLEVYGDIRERIHKGEDVTWYGKYPSPLDTAMNNIHELVASKLQKVERVTRKNTATEARHLLIANSRLGLTTGQVAIVMGLMDELAQLK